MYLIFSEILQKMGITPYRLCKDTGISQSTLTNWKNGNYVPKIDKLRKIADYLGVSLEYLMGKSNGSAPEGSNAHSGCQLCTVVSGNGMSGIHIFDGDTVLIRRQEQIENGEIGAFMIDGRTELKRFYLTDDGYTVLLSENKNVLPLVYPAGKEIPALIGKAIGVKWK
ncbi:MAG: LexA family transcriptional regulator [Eubacteriales bacterium]